MRESNQFKMNGSASSISGRLHAAFSKPIFQRCQEITDILAETSIKELYGILPALIENIFGFNNQPGWGINTCKAQYQDFRDLRHLLGPQGPLLTAIYKLCTDPYLKYEFPVACLPLSTQRSLEEGNPGTFYSGKVQLTHTGRPHNMLRLNPFEFYFFHFTHYLVGPTMSRGGSWGNPSESLYPVLLEDYMAYFLPLDGASGPPPPVTASQGVKSAIYQHSPVHSHRQSPASSQRSPFLGLLRLQKQSGHHTNTQAPVANEVTEEQTWRSQTFLQIIVEQWMGTSGYDLEQFAAGQSNHSWLGDHYASRDFHHVSRDPPHVPYDPYCTPRDPLRVSRDMSHSARDPYYYIILESHLPHNEQVRLVRMVVKHLHYFVNTSPPPIVTSPYSVPTTSPWNEFKRSLLPQFVQKRLYQFLKHNFERWPLDSSFRLTMETWLSYIQPWRYTDVSQAKLRESDVVDNSLDEKWRQFVRENLLFYTVLFESFLQRSLRLDLCAPKSAYMVFRVAKILSLPNLQEFLSDAERCLFEPSLTRSFHSASFHGNSYLGNASMRHHGNAAPSSMTLQFSELEGPMFEYQPMFCDATVSMVGQLILQMCSAKENAQNSSQKPSHNNSSFFSLLGFGSKVEAKSGSNPDMNTTTMASYDYDEFGVGGDIRKLESYLDQATANLCNVFGLMMPDKSQYKCVTWGATDSLHGNQKPDTLTPDVYMTEDGPKLSPLGRYQLINGLRKFDVAYEGDPDLQPIRSFESPILVRATHELASFINHKYGAAIESLYHRDDFTARMAQQFISLPFAAHQSAHLSPASKQRRQERNQPRVSLRWLASYQNIGLILALYAFLYMWFGLGVVSISLLLVACLLLYTPVMAVLRPARKQKTT